jgi:hypothetical protein
MTAISTSHSSLTVVLHVTRPCLCTHGLVLANSCLRRRDKLLDSFVFPRCRYIFNWFALHHSCRSMPRRSLGLQHSAFSLRKEGNLDQSPYFTKHIPRGELIELLTKSLLYIEVESHWKDSLLAKNCKAGFSLLDSHTCSPEPVSVPAVDLRPTSVEKPKDTSRQSEDRVDTAAKRKSSPPPVEDNRAEKRARTDPDPDADTAVQECSFSFVDSASSSVSQRIPRPEENHLWFRCFDGRGQEDEKETTI